MKRACFLVSLASLIAVECERFYALRKAEVYESIVDPVFSLIAIPICIGFGVTAISLQKIELISSTVPVLLAVGVLVVSIMFVFVFSVALSRKQKSTMERRFDHTTKRVSTRYTMVENVRSMTMLRVFIPFQAGALFLNVGAFSIMLLVVLPGNKRLYLIIQTVLYMTTWIRILGSMLIAFLLHAALRKRAKRLKQGFCALLSNSVEVAPPTPSMSESNTRALQQITSSTGQQLNFSSDRENEMYFKTYKDMWEN